ncbi:MAG: NosD domain-containing protein, partial [Candidatus Thorarchaeota archaeon]
GDYTGLSSLISHNLISNCSIGMWLAGDGSIIRNNTLLNNSLGVETRGTGNYIYYNTFLENYQSATDRAVNYWDDSVSMGNYWDRYFTVNDRWPVYLDDDAPIIVPIDPVVLPPDSNVTLYFTAVDNTPFSYSVLVDGILFEEDSWDGDVVIIEISMLSIGSHEVEITFTDINGNFASQVVQVRIQNPVPMIPIVIGVTTIIGVVAVVFLLKRRR